MEIWPVIQDGYKVCFIVPYFSVLRNVTFI